ncbi:hypothetical protein B296_00014206 [Ensete ventricosum]|uniref:Uncharacterized protein n=1 Tax=Ensete ventricosum TaxID=4639 RepID=A0A427AUL0_ENSVE|nr:hypothetical protein B296_00014206 [Ensete ventricosum]
MSTETHLCTRVQGPIDPHPSPVGSLSHDLVRNLEIRKGWKRFGPKEEDDHEEEEGIRDNRQEAVSGPIEEEPHRRSAGRREHRQVPPPPKKHISNWTKQEHPRIKQKQQHEEVNAKPYGNAIPTPPPRARCTDGRIGPGGGGEDAADWGASGADGWSRSCTTAMGIAASRVWVRMGGGVGVGEPGEEDLERDERMESPVSSRLGVCGLLAFYVLPDLVVVLNTLKSWTSLRHRTVPQATKIVNDTE